MERLKKQDADAGVERQAVTDEQRAAIAEIRNFYEAKLAELEVMHQSKCAPRSIRKRAPRSSRDIAATANGWRPSATRK